MLKEVEEGSCSNTNLPLCVFSSLEILDATCCFDPRFIIGDTSHGNIYRATFQRTPVAIKVLNRHSTRAFQPEIHMMSKLRHPNIAVLIGACEEDCALIYEYVANGSLGDRLKCKDNSPPLPWQTRIKIATELCCVLVFLHSNPCSIVHGDLNLGNILLDSNFSCKFSGFITCQSPHLRRDFRDIAVDPHFLRTGELSPNCDYYSFGIILLQLLTGWSSYSNPEEIREAIDGGNLGSLLDELADWPILQATQLAHLGLSFCASNACLRPDPQLVVWSVLGPMLGSSRL